MISCIVIDDEPLALQQLEQYVNNTPSLSLKGGFDSAIDALSFLRTNSVDLLFVDINMPQLSGLEFVEALPFGVKVIFVTAYREYALEGFALDAADYLLKPISYASFLKSVEKVRCRYFNKEEAVNTSGCHMFVRSEGRSVRVTLNDIVYIESQRDYLDIHTLSGDVITIHGSLSSIGERLSSDNFVRVHRSFIVNLDQVTVIERNSIVFDRLYIPISDQAKEQVSHYIKL